MKRPRFAFSSLPAGYGAPQMRGDLVAGVTTAVMLIPQAMAYAMLAGLPPEVGLYASGVPLVVYGVLGTSPVLAVGPVAMVSLLVAEGVEEIATRDSPAYVLGAVALAAMVGALQVVLGWVRGGFLVNFLSHPVVAGFTSAAALIIGFGQLDNLLGVDLPRSSAVHTIILSAVQSLDEVDGATVVVGVGSLTALILLKRWAPAFPRALLVVVASTVAVAALGLDVAVVGVVPAGLPVFAVPEIETAQWAALAPTAVTIALVGFMESISVAKAFARRNGYEVTPNRELVALGLANLSGALCGAYPVTGGFSRTAVNAQAGARSGVASIVTALVVALTLWVLTPLFHHLPKATLAAIIMAAVLGLIDVYEAKHLWRVKRSDLALMLLTFVSTLFLGIEEGLLAGIVTSIAVFVISTTRPHTAVLGLIPGTEAYRNVLRHPEARTTPGVLIVRIDAQLYFGNATFLKETLTRLEAEQATPLHAVVLDASSINQLDSSAEVVLAGLAQDYRRRGIELHLAGTKGPVMDVLQRSGFAATLGPRAFHLRVHDALSAIAHLNHDAPDVRAETHKRPA